MTNSFDENIDFATNSTEAKKVYKQAHCISNKTFVVIDDRLVKLLQIDGENTWFEQEQIENGIVLRIHRLPSNNNN